MKAVSIYEKNDWSVVCQYGSDLSEMKGSIRWVTHRLVDMKTYEFIINWKVEEVQGLCMRLLIKDT
jgi:hypothetical protein